MIEETIKLVRLRRLCEKDKLAVYYRVPHRLVLLRLKGILPFKTDGWQFSNPLAYI